MSVVIETTVGDLTVDLFLDERPIACLNFLKLCRIKYYNYNLFHTVQQGFIAQTGDPSGASDGGSSIWGVVEGQHKRFFEAEHLPKISHSSPGMLSLVSAGKNLVGSQFFFTLGENLTSLDGTHCVIGEVVEGHEVLRKLNNAIVDEDFRPYQDIRITHTVILEDPFHNPRGLQEPSRSPSPSAERLKNGRIAADEDIDDTQGKTAEEMQEMLADREAKARATILEIVGDLPDAEMAPPENVLFVCKLNPVTTDDDLEIIFSRFGLVKGCEVIRDRKTGDSLQYAFVEFEEQKSCEAAYFKMDNVLIDDRRIHVDFSQSVAKIKWRGKGRGIEGPEGKLDFDNLRENNGHNSRGRDKDRDRNNVRNRMSSAERRKARERRHQEQTESEKRNRPTERRRSRSRYRNERNRSRSRDKSQRKLSKSKERNGNRRSRSTEGNGNRRSRSRDGHYRTSFVQNDRRINNSRQKHRKRSRSYEQRNERRREESQRRTSRYHSPERKHQGDSHRRRNDAVARPQSNDKKTVRNIKRPEERKTKSKKSKRTVSSSSSSSESSSSTSASDSSSDSSSSDSSSTESSSSSDERSKHKKKSSIRKRTKTKSKHKSNKKRRK